MAKENKESYEKQIADKQEEIASLKARLANVKASKKEEIIYYNQAIKKTSTTLERQWYRRQKMTVTERFNMEIEYVELLISRAKEHIESCKRSMAKLKSKKRK